MGRRHRHLNRIHLGAVIDLDTRFITGYSNGANPTSWPNRGDSANNFVRGGTASGLVYDTNQQGGQPRMRYPNGNATLRRANFNPIAWGYSNAKTVVCACRDGKGNSTQRLLYRWGNTVSNIMNLWAAFSDNNTYFDMGNETVGQGRITGPASTTSSPVIYSGMANGATGSIRRNGAQLASGTMTQSVTSLSRTLDLGSVDIPSHFVGDYYAFIHAPVASEPIRRRIEQSVAFSFKIANG